MRTFFCALTFFFIAPCYGMNRDYVEDILAQVVEGIDTLNSKTASYAFMQWFDNNVSPYPRCPRHARVMRSELANYLSSLQLVLGNDNETSVMAGTIIVADTIHGFVNFYIYKTKEMKCADIVIIDAEEGEIFDLEYFLHNDFNYLDVTSFSVFHHPPSTLRSFTKIVSKKQKRESPLNCSVRKRARHDLSSKELNFVPYKASNAEGDTKADIISIGKTTIELRGGCFTTTIPSNVNVWPPFIRLEQEKYLAEPH